MIRMFSFYACCVSVMVCALAPVMRSKEKALEYAKLFEKPILCFVDSALSEGKRGEMAEEFFSHPSVYNPLSSGFIFMDAKEMEGVMKGVVILSSDGKKISTVTSYHSLEGLVKIILKEDFFRR